MIKDYIITYSKFSILALPQETTHTLDIRAYSASDAYFQADIQLTSSLH